MTNSHSDSPGNLPRPPTRWFQKLFARYSRHYLGKHLHSLRARVRAPEGLDDSVPVIACLNHASWWDPLVGLILAFQLLGDRRHHAPIDAEGLRKYPFLWRAGFFPVERDSLAGARRFLDQAGALCQQPGVAIWITPQGRFVDPRERPVELESGLGHLLHRLDRAVVWPLAMEYPFWEERTPEALVLSGEPLWVEGGREHSPREWTARVARRLEEAQDELRELAVKRDEDSLPLLISGSHGVGGIYDAWKSLVARLRGQEPDRAHGGRRT